MGRLSIDLVSSWLFLVLQLLTPGTNPTEMQQLLYDK
jgi:hypothetical protein